MNRLPKRQFHRFATVVCTFVAVALTDWQLTTSSGTTGLFGRWDVLVVALLAAAPFATLISGRLKPLDRWNSLFVPFGLMAVTAIAFRHFLKPDAMNGFSLVTATMARTTVATTVMLVVMMLSRELITVPALPSSIDQSWTAKLTLIAITTLIPAAYVDSVAEGLRIELERSLQSRRFSLALHHADRLWQLDPNGSIEDQSIRAVNSKIAEEVADLESALRRPLSQHATSSEIVHRVRILMQLDRNVEAVRLLVLLAQDPRFQPISLDYLGLCFQRLGRYQESLNAYQAAVTHWASQPTDARQQSSIASAWKGVGFAARRLNQRGLEEHAYRRLVDISPTASNHMLLAQCYREHQKTELAVRHNAVAVQLDPDLQERSESMLSSISADHFGCWLVPRS